MLGIMFQKLWSKKWMVICLLFGSILLTATLVSFPLYQSAVFDKMLQSEFRNNLSDTGLWPARLGMNTYAVLGEDKEIIDRIEKTMDELEDKLGVTAVYDIRTYYLFAQMKLASKRRDINIDDLNPGIITGLSDHVTMLSGQMYSDEGMTEDGCIEVIISQGCMNKSNLLLGDVLQIHFSSDNVVSLKITGVFRPNEDRHYWENTTYYLDNMCLMQEEQYRKHFLREDFDTYCASHVRIDFLFDYEILRSSQVPGLLSAIEEVDYYGNTCISLLETFQGKKPMISATLFFLEIPVLVLLGAFLFMVSGQMYELEKNEISVIKSRGSSAFQIFRLYLYQNLFLTAVGTVLGFPLGIYFVHILGSASNFLEFGLRRNLEIHFEARTFAYMAAAAAAAVFIMTIPAIKHSKVSIVHLKQNKSSKKRRLWEYLCVDLICLGIGAYGYYSYTQSSKQVIENVLTEQTLDPLLYLSSSLFIVGAGLLFLRLQPLLVRLVYVIGKHFWRPASYASFLDSLKNGRKQQFIMLFLILTVSLGTFYATVARTILQNTLNNVEYLDGTDIIVREIWDSNIAKVKAMEEAAKHFPVRIPPLRYKDKNFALYSTLDTKKYTKVYYADPSTDNAYASATVNGQTEDITFMAIQTKEFGEITWLDQELTEDHYYTYLNTLANNPTGVLVSRSFQTQLNCNIGDELWYTYNPAVEGRPIRGAVVMKCKILDFVDYWPTYIPSKTYVKYNEEVTTDYNYLVIANAAPFEESSFSIVIPYEVWIDLGDDLSSSEMIQWINENNIKVEKYVDKQSDRMKTMEEPLLQGTNGILTMSFLVMLLLCAVGYLIYWIMSIRSRELIFGTLRAFGMHRKELFHMLILEQIFSGLLSLAAGMGIGKIASLLYVPLLQTAYAASNQVLPIHLLTDSQDMVRLYGTLALMMAICLIVLVILVLRLNITKALKLGEE